MARPDLVAALRDHGPAVVASWIAGPIVLADLDAGTVVTLCGVDAQDAARRWGQQLADSTLPAPGCVAREAERGFVCAQDLGGNHWPRLRGAVVGNTSTPQLVDLLNRFQSAADRPVCP
jgi:hypothetical protein